jgi:hypothetical protein
MYDPTGRGENLGMAVGLGYASNGEGGLDLTAIFAGYFGGEQPLDTTTLEEPARPVDINSSGMSCCIYTSHEPITFSSDDDDAVAKPAETVGLVGLCATGAVGFVRRRRGVVA